MKVRSSIKFGLIFFILFYIFVPIRYTVKELIPYQNEALSLIKSYCRPWQFFNPPKQIVYFDNLKYPTIGYCSRDLTGFRVVFDKKVWDRLSSDDKFQSAFHEFGHCYLGLKHVDNPFNYMYYSDYIVPSNDEVRQQFIEDLKKKCQ